MSRTRPGQARPTHLSLVPDMVPAPVVDLAHSRPGSAGGTREHDHVVAVMLARDWSRLGRGPSGTQLSKGPATVSVPYLLRRSAWRWRSVLAQFASAESVSIRVLAAEVDELDELVGADIAVPDPVTAACALLEAAGWTLTPPRTPAPRPGA